MKFLKILALIVMMAGVIASAQAIDAKMDIYPSNNIAQPGEDFLVFGYVYSSDIIEDSDIKIKIYNDDDHLVDTYSPRVFALNGADSAREVYFYSMIDIDTEGDYDIVLKVEGSTEAKQSVDVGDISDRDVVISDFDYRISGSRITFDVKVLNKDDSDHEVTVYLQGDKNFNSPKTFTIDVNEGETETVSKAYSTSDFGSNEFMVACQAKANSGSKNAYSAPDYVLVDNNYVYSYDYTYDYNYDSDEYQYYNGYVYTYPSYGYGNVIISNIELDTNVFYPGDVVEGKVFIRNVGSSESQYRFEYTYDNQIFKMGEVGYVLPGQTAEQDIAIEIPDTDTFKLSAKVISGTTDLEEKTYMISHKLKYFTPYFSAEDISVNVGENSTIDVTIKNRGNEDDSYSIKVSGWSFYKLGQESLALVSGSEKTIPLSIEVPESADMDTYPIIVDIVNSDGMHRTKTIELSVTKPESKQSDVVFKDEVANHYFEANETIAYTMIITNLESADKEYYVEADAAGIQFAIAPEAFTLGSMDSKEVTISATPSGAKDYKPQFSVFANGEEIFSKTVQLNYTENKQGTISGLTGFAIFEGKAWMPAVYMLALIGMITIGYIGYRIVNERAKAEKVVQSNETQKPATQATKPATQVQPQLTPEQMKAQQYMSQWPREQRDMSPKTDYPEDSFMRRF
ncbi:MAG: hypothetical protein PHC66_01330 [Candidatus Nanoarchaeia archaeon]|nr:hypothetical protein [Candidatus Nanoarchaeia archaeon]MDD5239136.1 hypothetical protein [Candidatus Nanoarchaeia archaeon]